MFNEQKPQAGEQTSAPQSGLTPDDETLKDLDARNSAPGVRGGATSGISALIAVCQQKADAANQAALSAL